MQLESEINIPNDIMKQNMCNDDERQYLQMMQSNIERMANNSANCKTWLATIVAGFMAISCGIDSLHWWLLVVLVPICMFWYLDGFYLSLERGMRNRQKDFLNKINDNGDIYINALFNFAPLFKKELTEEDKQQGFVKTSCQFWTKSVRPFYLILAISVIIITLALNI